MKTLSKAILNGLSGNMAADLPERVLQFGTGVLLRGLPDYFIEKANRQGLFNGRIVVVKSTGQGSADAFARQDGLYTLYIKGLQHGKEVLETMLVSAISRVLHAATEWEEIARVAHNPELAIVISNTTEVGIVLDEDDDLTAAPPASFPGKLTALLYQRFLHFNGDTGKGWVILPTELISDNGDQLKSVVLELAHKHGLGDAFIAWLEEANDFCNTLVDRIVPGALPPAEVAAQEARLGYRDELAIMAEPFRLWAVEADSARVRDRLSFAGADEGIVIAPDIHKFKELKLRLLNGTHTFTCGLAIACGFTTVKAAMQDLEFARYVRQLMQEEIVPAITGGAIEHDEALVFADSVIDRFSNPFLDHRWLSISMNFTSKMRMRNVALIRQYVQQRQMPPKCMALGFAAYLRFMKGEQESDGQYIGQIGDVRYTIQDEYAPYFAAAWQRMGHHALVDQVLADQSLWHDDLSRLAGFADLVKQYVGKLLATDRINLKQQVETLPEGQ
ncbi:tagaturonate reductase [Parapedobacter deserti]|uniref:Tagaturonate reductase n=1 Tax=Parapedobacter deserti TaxID=1912957 RepID=A0ABV7JIR0_9SPHI